MSDSQQLLFPERNLCYQAQPQWAAGVFVRRESPSQSPQHQPPTCNSVTLLLSDLLTCEPGKKKGYATTKAKEVFVSVFLNNLIKVHFFFFFYCYICFLPEGRQPLKVVVLNTDHCGQKCRQRNCFWHLMRLCCNITGSSTLLICSSQRHLCEMFLDMC